jgi:O-antigen/teichoic acid export membrane protein
MWLMLVLNILIGQLDILLLGWMQGEHVVGLYAPANRLANLVSLNLVAINTVSAPIFAKLYANRDMKKLQLVVHQASFWLVIPSLVVTVLYIAFGRMILSLFGSEYISSYPYLVILSVGQLVNASAGSVGYLLNMTGYQNTVSKTFVVIAAVSCFLHWVLIQFMQATGAAMANAAIMMLWNVVLVYQVYRLLGLSTVFFWKGKLVQ